MIFDMLASGVVGVETRACLSAAPRRLCRWHTSGASHFSNIYLPKSRSNGSEDRPRTKHTLPEHDVHRREVISDRK